MCLPNFYLSRHIFYLSRHICWADRGPGVSGLPVISWVRELIFPQRNPKLEMSVSLDSSKLFTALSGMYNNYATHGPKWLRTNSKIWDRARENELFIFPLRSIDLINDVVALQCGASQG